MKTAFLVVLLTLLLSGVMPLVLDNQPVLAAGTIVIRADGSIDPPTAPISTDDGFTYTATDDIYGQLVVDRDGIVLDGGGHSLQGTGSGNGISIIDRTNVTVKNIHVENFECGVHIVASSYNNISGNNIAGNGYGIALEQNSSQNIIRGNALTSNSNAGVLVDFSSHNIICYNSFIGNAQQACTHASVNSWNDDYPFGGNYWSDYTGVDDRSALPQDLTGSDGIGDVAYVIDPGSSDEYPLMDPAPVKEWVYGVSRTLPLNVVFVGFEEEAVNTDTIDTNIKKSCRFRYGYHDLVYDFDVTYHSADPSYYDALMAFVLENSATGNTSALDAAALQVQKETGTKMSIFTTQTGRAINATAVEEWFVANPLRADSEPGYCFYVMNFTGLDPAHPGSKHWYSVTEVDTEANRPRDFWRLDWDNALNPDVGFPYACFTSQSRVFFIDPSAHQWYLAWASTWWGLPESGPKYAYYDADLCEFLEANDASTGPGRTALAYYLAGWIEDGLVNLLAPSLYPNADVFGAGSVSVQTLILNNASDFGYDNEAMAWIADPTLYEEAIADLVPWMDVEVVVRFEDLADHPQLEAVFDAAVLHKTDGWTYYDGMQIWHALHSIREYYFDLTAADLVMNGYVYLEKDMSMHVYGGEYTGLGGSRQILVMQELSRYFENDGVTPKAGLGRTLIHEAGHNFGFPHTFTSTAYAGDFSFDVMGYYPYAYYFTQFRKDAFTRLVVDFRLAALQEELDRASTVYERTTPDETIEASLNEVSLQMGGSIQAYEELRFLEAYSKVIQTEDALAYLENLVLEHLVAAPPGIPDTDPGPPDDTRTRRCFIATAAYGTPMADEVRSLRQFRDRYLLKTATGRAAVDTYYRISPPAAEFIRVHPGLKPAVRLGLMPVVAISAIAVRPDGAEEVATAGSLLLASAAAVAWLTNRRGKGLMHA
ncbi:MAG: CFI-box-CTERM domain-containing protein [Dehalococcoidia bacterium]